MAPSPKVKPVVDLFHFEKELWPRYRFIAGLDEAGRGAWAGPVVAAAAVFEPGCVIDGVDDSKKLTPAKREELYAHITQRAVSYGVGVIDSETVDAINILEAAKLTMLQALEKIAIPVQFLLIDGNMSLATPTPQKSIIDGDALSFSIAAASILAKVTRDRLMISLSRDYPDYGFENHKGYGTPEHQAALKRIGCAPIHRRTYAPIAALISNRQPTDQNSIPKSKP